MDSVSARLGRVADLPYARWRFLFLARKAREEQEEQEQLASDHQDRERPRNRRALTLPAAGSWRWRRSSLEAHRIDETGGQIQRDGARAQHRLEVLLHFEAGRAFLLHDGHRAVAVRAERFHRFGIERRAV